MYRFEESRRLAAMVLIAALLALPLATAAQGNSSDADLTAVHVVPGPQPTPEQVGDALMLHQRYQAAIEQYKQAPTDSPDVWNKLGIAYQMMFNLRDAEHSYQAALKLNRRNVSVINNLGTIYDSEKDYRAAERAYRKALKIDPKSATVLKNLGTNLLAQHKYDKGWQVYQQALASDPQIFDRTNRLRVDNPSTIEGRGAMNFYMAKGCVRAGMTSRAIEYLRSALNEGFVSTKKLVVDQEFSSLRGVPAFEQLLAEQRER